MNNDTTNLSSAVKLSRQALKLQQILILIFVMESCLFSKAKNTFMLVGNPYFETTETDKSFRKRNMFIYHYESLVSGCFKIRVAAAVAGSRISWKNLRLDY